MSYKPKMILSIEDDAKTVKGEKYDVLTGILYLASADTASDPTNTDPRLHSISVCPMAELAKCKDPCLLTAGRGTFHRVQAARVAKTHRFFVDREHFMADFVYSVQTLIRMAHRRSVLLGRPVIPMTRPNGTSDILWETVPVTHDGQTYANLMALFPTHQWYDYTKIPNRKVPANYDLTFSYSGVPAYQKVVNKALKRKMRMAVVFRHATEANPLPKRFMGLRVVNGDDSDVRVRDPQGVVVGLYAKGRAKRDVSGFVVNN